MFKLRDYQQKGYDACMDIIKDKKICILNGEVRIGKTHVALKIASNYNKVLFVTKKKAISSIENDYRIAKHSFDITIINYESLHKVVGVFDLVVVDESHNIAAYPKPTGRTKKLKAFVTNDLLLMTGTLLPESNSQLYHQLWISPYSPYKNCGNFYKWHKMFGKEGFVYTSYGKSKCYKTVDYSKIKTTLDSLKVVITQKDAGFTTKVNEHVVKVDMKQSTVDLMNRLRKDLVIEGVNETVLAETGVKLMSKLQQLSSGTVKFESGNAATLDTTKVDYIAERWTGVKKAIFYFYKQELEMIKEKFGNEITTDLDEFNTTDKSIALQQISGAEGVNLSKADVLIYVNFGFSNTKYIQSKDRLTTMERKTNDVYFIISNNGIDMNVYNALQSKRDYVLRTFERDESLLNK